MIRFLSMMRAERRPYRIVLAAMIATAAAAAEGADFRYSNWGDSMADVKAAETATFHHEGEDEMAFTDSSIEGIDGGIIYLFDRGRLVRGLYVSRNEYAGGDGVLQDFERMKSYYSDRLGAEGREERDWKNGPPEGGADLEASLAAGELRLAHHWTVGRSRIAILMTGKDGGVFLRSMTQPVR
jgi:hypothetical protein